MPFPAISDPVPATVITAAWEIANPLAAVRWLRSLMGNADPPGSSYVVVSTGPATAAWSKIPADALAAGAVVSHLTYTPVNQAGDTMTGNLTAPGLRAGANGFLGGSTTAGVPSVLGIVVGNNGVSAPGVNVGAAGVNVSGGGGVHVTGGGSIDGGTKTGGVNLSAIGLNVGANGIACDGLVSPGGYGGGSTSVGVPSVLGIVVGSNGVSTPGVNAGAAGVNVSSGGAVSVTGGGGVSVTGGGGYSGGSTAVGALAVLGLNVGLSGISTPGVNAGAGGVATSGPVASTAAGAPFTAVSGTVCTGVNADMTDGAHAQTTAAAGRIPIAGPGGTLDPAWLPASGIAGFPSNVIAMVAIAAQIPAGFTRYSTLDGRLPVGAGTTFSVTFTENTTYGTNWAHQHTGNSFAVSATGTISGSATGGSGDVTSTPSASSGAPSGTPPPDLANGNHTHTLAGVHLPVSGSASVSGAATGDTTNASWVIPMKAVVYVIKT